MKERMCPVPPQACGGARINSGPGGDKYGGRRKSHTSAREVLDCESRYLVTQGYEKIGPRQFRPADGGEVLVLSRNPGAEVRRGKEGRRMTQFHGGIILW